MSEKNYENLFNIETTGEQTWNNNHKHYHPYEATSYSVIEVLFNNYELSCNDYIVDFGSGKGRLNFYISYFFNSNVIGIEMNEDLYKNSLINKELFLQANTRQENKINFICCLAQDYKINARDNKFYFFNPFSVQIFIKIIDNILKSYEVEQRIIDIIMYYPSEEYIYYLENCTLFKFKYDIPIKILCESDVRERFIIYRLEI